MKNRSRRGKIVSLACSNCRKRKSRCGGERPCCDQCLKRGLESCKYDLKSDGRRTSQAHLNKILSRRLQRLESLCSRIKLGGDECRLAVQEIQQNELLDLTCDGEEQGRLLDDDESPYFFFDKSTRPDSSLQDDSTASSPNISTRDKSSKLDASLQDDSIANSPSISARDKSSSLGTSGQDMSGQDGCLDSRLNISTTTIPPHMIKHLLDLYFCWQHNCYKVLDQELFLRDMKTEGKFYSRFLLHSILSVASMLCDSPLLRCDPSDPSTAGYMFFRQAKSELDQELHHNSVTTVQGLLLLSIREVGNGRNSIAGTYSEMAIRMALDLGLHLDCSGLSQVGYLTSEDHKVRNTTFWGCYLFDQIWSLYFRRQSIMRLAYATADKPEYIEDELPQTWVPIYSCGKNCYGLSTTPIEFYPHNSFTALLKLSGIIEEIIVTMLIHRNLENQADLETRCRDFIERLTLWENNLPSSLSNKGKNCHPTIIMIHALSSVLRMYFYRCFPDLCENALKSRHKIIDLFSRFKSLYSLQMTSTISVYIVSTVVSACSDKSLPDQNVDNSLAQSMALLKDMGQTSVIAAEIWRGLQYKSSCGNPYDFFNLELI